MPSPARVGAVVRSTLRDLGLGCGAAAVLVVLYLILAWRPVAAPDEDRAALRKLKRAWTPINQLKVDVTIQTQFPDLDTEDELPDSVFELQGRIVPTGDTVQTLYWTVAQALLELDDLRRLRRCDRCSRFYLRKVASHNSKHSFCSDLCRGNFNYQKKLKSKGGK